VTPADTVPPLLSVTELATEFRSARGTVRAVDRVSLHVAAGETLGLVGESGSGKSALCRSIIQLFAGAAARIAEGSVRLDGHELVGAPSGDLRRLRGSRIAMVFQDPTTALNPVMTVGAQLREAVRVHERVGRRAADARAVDLLRAVQVPNPGGRLTAYPHELSGGLRQRVVIAMALAGRPQVILADEPTTALDVTVQDQILTLLKRIQTEAGTAILLVTHDLGVVAQTCDRVAVMYAGRLVETGPVRAVLKHPRHPYTRALLDALPSRDRARPLVPIEGAPPSLADAPEGCRFHPRCAMAAPECLRGRPPLVPVPEAPDHRHACLRGGMA
jgi:peptide/nickel transport system ATP-binding protein/oligopeptide transport system ATP-binding protein